MQLSRVHCLLLITLLLVLTLADRSTGARSRSSFRSSSYRSGSSRSGRYGSTRGSGFGTLSLLVSSRFSYRVNRLAYSRGIFFSTWSWRRGHSDYSDSAALCFNVVDSLPAEYNSSIIEPWLYQSRIVYGLFVCPMDSARPDRIYCCGSEEAQRCCSFMEESGRVIGLFLGLSLALAVCSFIAYRFYRTYLIRKQRLENSHSSTVIAAAIISSGATAPFSYTATDSGTTGGVWTSKTNEQPFSHSEYEQQQPSGYSLGLEHPGQPTEPQMMQPPPYPVNTPPPPAYWDVSNPGHGQLTPVRF